MPGPNRHTDFAPDQHDPLRPLLSLPGVADSVGATRRAVDAVLGHRILRTRSAAVTSESALRGAWASAVLEGSTATLEQVRAGQQSEADPAEGASDIGQDDGGPIMLPVSLPPNSADAGVADPLVQGSLRVFASLGALAETWPRAPRQVLARLHVLAAADLVDRSEAASVLGRPRGGPDAGEVAARLDGLAQLIAPGGTGARAGMVAAIVQGELLSLRPFGLADGIVARAAARLTFVDRGLDPKSLMALEVGQLELRDELDEALEGYRSGTAEGVGRWLVVRGQADALGAQETLAICVALERG